MQQGDSKTGHEDRARLAKLRHAILEHELDAMLITDPLNRRYLSGFTGTAGSLLVTKERSIIVVDFRYYERAAREAPGWEQARITNTFQETLGQMVVQAGIQRLGLEADHVTVAEMDEMRSNLPEVTLVPLNKVAVSMRAVKDKEEIRAIEAAVACADAAYHHLCHVITPGMREIEVAWELESYMRLHGASATSFPIIVASGPNGAMPHATSSERHLGLGEPIVMDFGALVNGYCSDITRTICLGEPGEQYTAIWRLVLEAQRTVETKLRPGMGGAEADAIARNVFAQAGYADAFGHGLGHGVGLAIHEAPWLNRTVREGILEPGMVFTVEPGLYFPGWGGVRIEDIVVMEKEGARVLTRAPKDPLLEI